MLLPTCGHPQGSGSGGSKGVRETIALGVATWHLQSSPSSPLPITQKPLGRAALRDTGARVTRDRRPGVHQPQPHLHIRQLTCDRWQPSPAPPTPPHRPCWGMGAPPAVRVDHKFSPGDTAHITSHSSNSLWLGKADHVLRRRAKGGLLPGSAGSEFQRLSNPGWLPCWPGARQVIWGWAGGKPRPILPFLFSCAAGRCLLRTYRGSLRPALKSELVF